MRKRPEKLWTGDWRAQSDAARRSAANGRPAREAEEAPTTPMPARRPPRRTGPSRRIRAFVAGGLAAVLLVTGAFAAGMWADGDGDGASSTALPEAAAPLPRKAGQTQAGAVYASASPAVVSVRAGNSTGTGFLIAGDGRIVTNYHVVSDNDSVQLKFGPDGKTIDGQVRGTDPSSDLALVKIDAGDIPGGVRPLGLADSRSVRVGDTAIAIGNPFGLDRTATEGIVSGVGREIRAPNGFSIDSVIQTDAPINPGNSGGPLLNAAGQVIGVNSQIETGGSQGNVGIGFAVPSNKVKDVAPALTRGEEIKRAYLGLESSPPTGGGTTGAEVQGTVSGGPAQRAGLRTGDVVTKVDGTAVTEPTDIAQAIADNKPGDQVPVEVRRDGSTVTLNVTLGTRPASTTP